MTVSLVARRHGVAPNQLFRWRRLAAQGALIATRAQEEVVAASEYRALQSQVRELQRLLGKKTMEAEILKEALEVAAGPKKATVALAVVAQGRFAMKAVCEMLGVARSNIAERVAGPLASSALGPAAAARRRARRRDQGGHRRHADLWLSPRPGDPAPQGTGRRARRRPTTSASIAS